MVRRSRRFVDGRQSSLPNYILNLEVNLMEEEKGCYNQMKTWEKSLQMGKISPLTLKLERDKNFFTQL